MRSIDSENIRRTVRKPDTAPPHPKPKRTRRRYKNRKSCRALLRDHADQIVRLLNEKRPQEEIAKKLDTTRPTLHNAIRALGTWVFVKDVDPNRKSLKGKQKKGADELAV